MKKILTCAVMLFIAIAMFTVNVSAAGNTVVAGYDIATGSLSISAHFDKTSADLLATITVFKKGSAVNDTHLPLLFKTAFVDDEGKIDILTPVPSTFTSGKYTVRVATERVSYDKDFLYAKSSDIRSIMLLLNSAQTSADVKNIITSNYDSLGLDGELVSPYVAELADAYYTICKGTVYSDEKVFYPYFMQCLAAAEIKCGENVTDTLNKYKVYIGSAVNEISLYPAGVQSKIAEYVAASVYADGLLSDQLPKLRVLAFFKNAKTWGEAKLNVLGINQSGEVYIDNFTVLSPNLNYYNSVKNVNLVFDNLFGKSSSINSFDELKLAFESSAKLVYDQENVFVPSSGGGGGSSFGGASVPSATVVPGTKPEDAVPPATSENTTPSDTSTFSDVSSHWAKDYIEKLAGANIVSGYPDGTFGPDKNVTRAEFAKMVISYSGLDTVKNDVDFADVNSNDWYYDYVSTALYYGFINGISDNEFAPNIAITRQDACVIIYRFLGDKITYSSNPEFIDLTDVSDYAINAVSALYENGILTGYDDNSFKPQNLITRAETAVILSRVNELLK